MIANIAKQFEPTNGRPRYDRRTLELLLRFFGRTRRPETLSRRARDAFIVARRSGKLRSPKAVERKVGEQTLEHDMKLLSAILNWATLSRDDRGNFLLDRNPVRGLPFPREESPQRALLSDAQYVMGGREECLVLAWETGHRVGALRQLRWSDVDLEGGRMHFRGENDKIGHDHWNPLHAEAVAILMRERARAAAIGGAWVFPSLRDTRKALPRHTGIGCGNAWRSPRSCRKERYGTIPSDGRSPTDTAARRCVTCRISAAGSRPQR